MSETRIELSAPPKLRAGEDLPLAITLTSAENGQPIADLEPWLGARGHIIIVGAMAKISFMRILLKVRDRGTSSAPRPYSAAAGTQPFDHPERNRLPSNMVEAGGVEPPSGKARNEEPTCVDDSVVSARAWRTAKRALA